jgi:hypothetical protein
MTEIALVYEAIQFGDSQAASRLLLLVYDEQP